MYLINGNFKANISIYDRGLAYGDGLFETIAIIDQKPINWSLHYHRLLNGAERLGITIPCEETLLKGLNLLSVKQLAGDVSPEPSNKFIIKIIVTRGTGGVGYQCPDKQEENWVMMLKVWPEYSQQYYLEGIDVQQLDLNLSCQPALAGIKHLNRLEQVMAKQKLDKKYQEAVLLNNNDYVIEGISSNIYFVLNKVLCIPVLNMSGIEGTIRAQLIQTCIDNDIKYKIANFTLDDLCHSEEIFYSNSIIGLWPVKKLSLLNNKHYYYKLGNLYQQFAKLVNYQLKHPLIHL